MRLSGWRFVSLGALVGLLIVFASDQIVPAGSPYQAQMRIWLVARATGITTYLLIFVQVLLGLLLSHPLNQSTWKLSKRIFPSHENLLVFVLAFLAMHVVSIVLDPFAGVGIAGALIPGLSEYRSAPVGLGTLGLYALLITGLTARYTKLLPAGFWLQVHRLSLAVFALSWLHGLLAGTDEGALRPLYLATGLAVMAAATYRYWILRRRAAPATWQAEHAASRAPRPVAGPRPSPMPRPSILPRPLTPEVVHVESDRTP